MLTRLTVARPRGASAERTRTSARPAILVSIATRIWMRKKRALSFEGSRGGVVRAGAGTVDLGRKRGGARGAPGGDGRGVARRRRRARARRTYARRARGAA